MAALERVVLVVGLNVVVVGDNVDASVASAVAVTGEDAVTTPEASVVTAGNLSENRKKKQNSGLE